jgi:hypothetical protein
MSGPFKMKNSGLKMSAKSGSPMQANYASPAKDGTRFVDKIKAAGKAFLHGAKQTDQGINAAMDKYSREKKNYREIQKNKETEE